jgi:hypothetical protein
MNTAGQVTDGGAVKLRKVPYRMTKKRINNIYTRDCFCGGTAILGIWGTPYDSAPPKHNNTKRRMVDLWKHRYRFDSMFSPSMIPWIRSSADEV